MRPFLRSPEGLLYGTGALLCASGLLHMIVWGFMGGEWEGAISWRKPILFGFSSGLTAISLGWLMPKLRPSHWDGAISGLFCLAITGEVGLITFQQWRGVASHFNRSTPFDAQIETGMTLLISVVFLTLLELTRRSFQSLNTTIDLKRSIRFGLTFLILSCVIGFVIAAHGNQQLAKGNDPAIVGEAGVAKFPHGLAIHAIQIFPLICFFMRKAGMPEGMRKDQITWCILSMIFFLIYSVLQTSRGRARFDFDVISLVPLVLSVLVVLPPILLTLRSAYQQMIRGRDISSISLPRDTLG